MSLEILRPLKRRPEAQIASTFVTGFSQGEQVWVISEGIRQIFVQREVSDSPVLIGNPNNTIPLDVYLLYATMWPYFSSQFQPALNTYGGLIFYSSDGLVSNDVFTLNSFWTPGFADPKCGKQVTYAPAYPHYLTTLLPGFSQYLEIGSNIGDDNARLMYFVTLLFKGGRNA